MWPANTSKALELFEHCAAGGRELCALYIGQLYQFGGGNITKNVSRAIEVYENLTHIPHAAFNLAQLHLYGVIDPVSPDNAKAVKLATTAANFRHAY